MPEVLTPNHSTAADCRRILRKTVSAVLEGLAEIGHPEAAAHVDHDEIVHEIRKRLKTARAILRLLRDSIGGKTYHAENHEIRDVSRTFAVLRDAKILIETFDRLTDEQDFSKSTNSLHDIRLQLVAKKQKAARAIQKPGFIESQQQALNAVLDRIDRWPGDRQSWKRARAGLKRTYKAGRAAWKAAKSGRSNVKLHECRKQAKYLGYQLEFLHPVRPAAFDLLAKFAHDLSDRLGDDHDLAVLIEEIRTEGICPNAQLRATIERHIKSQRADLQQAAYEIGNALYGDDPELFDSCIQKCHHKWVRRSR